MRAEHDDIAFAVVRRGYDRTEVDTQLRRLRAELDSATLARDVARDDLRMLSAQLEQSRAEAQESRAAANDAAAEIERLAQQVTELATTPTTVDGMSQRLQQMVHIAQNEANEIRTRGTSSAAHVLSLAQAEADELAERSRAEADELVERSRAERAAVENELRVAREALRAELTEGRAQLDGLLAEREQHIERLEAELAQRRSTADAELADDLGRRRAAVLEQLEAQETLGRTEATRIRETAATEAREQLADATGQADRIRNEAKAGVAEAHRELEELRALQHQVSEQLTSVRALLDWTLPRIAASGAPAPAPAVPDLRLVESKPTSQPAALGAQPRPVGQTGATGWGTDWLSQPTRPGTPTFLEGETPDDAVVTVPDPTPAPAPVIAAAPATGTFQAVSPDEAPSPRPRPTPTARTGPVPATPS